MGGGWGVLKMDIWEGIKVKLKVGRSVLDILIGLKGHCKSFLGIIMYA